MDDRTLVKNILEGDMKAYKDLIRQYQRLVFHMVAKLVDNDQDREELCQDVFVKVYESLGSFNFDSKLSTWIATIAYRMSVNFLKKEKRRPEEDDLDHVAFSMGTADETLEDRDFAAFVHKLIDQMPEIYRSVLTLFHIEGFSYPEIVEVTGMPEGTVKNYLFRARKKLKDLSEPYIGKEIHRI